MSRSAAVFLAVGMTLAASLSAAVFEPERMPGSVRFKKILQFPDGAAWAIADGSPGKLLEYADGQWRDAGDWWLGVFAAGKAGGFYSAAAGADGGLWLLTASEGNFFAVKWNRATRRAEFATKLVYEEFYHFGSDDILLHPAPDGSLWVTTHDPHVFRIDSGGLREMFCADDSMRQRPVTKGKKKWWQTLDLAFDAEGAAWIWTASWIAYDGAEEALNGVARVKDGGVKWFGGIEGLPKGWTVAANFITVNGREELWLTLDEQGTFRLRLSADAVTVTRLEFPDGLNGREVFTVSGTVWAVNGRDYIGRDDVTDTLWRLSDSGGWQQIITGLDYTGNSALRVIERRPLATDGGFWLASSGRGLWWIPADGEPANIDWRKGFPASHPLFIIRDADGRLMVADGRGAWRLDPERALSLPAEKTDSRLSFFINLARAGDGNLFSMRRDAPRRWSADGWRDLPLPEDEQQRVTNARASLLTATDSRNRVWFIPHFYPEREKNLAYVWNIDTQTWDAPRNYLELIAEAAKSKPDWHFLFAAGETGKDSREAVFDRHGRAAFIGMNRVLWLFDGQRWRQLKAKDFQAAEENAEFDELQNRAADGDILVLVDEKKWWRLAEDGQWQPLAEKEYPPRRESLTLAGKQFSRDGASGFATADGDEWLVENNVLRRRRAGRTVNWIANEPNPFLVQDTQPIRNVITDNFGRRLFFAGRNRIVAVSDHPPDKRATLHLVVEYPAHDAATVRFTGSLNYGESLRWRLSDGDWGAWGRDTTGHDTVLKLEQLPPGEHTVEVQKMDGWLNVSPPLAVKVSINYDADQLARETAEKLFSENWDERKAAVKTLRRFPEQARAVLRQIGADREHLNYADRWWLDAALEQLDGR